MPTKRVMVSPTTTSIASYVKKNAIHVKTSQTHVYQKNETIRGEDTKRNLKHVKDCVATRYAARSPAMLARTVCLLSPSRRLISRYDWPSATSVRTRGT